MTNDYARAYTEVLEILKHFSREEYSKIPAKKIQFYEKYMDKGYDYKINPKIKLSEQHISKEANAVMISLFRDYFASDKQKIILEDLLSQNQEKLEEQQKNENANILESNQYDSDEVKSQELAITKYKESIFSKFINKIKMKLKN